MPFLLNLLHMHEGDSLFLAARPERLLVNAPVPEPFTVLLSSVVGLTVVDQQTPLAVTLAPPSDVIIPPEIAVVIVTELAMSG